MLTSEDLVSPDFPNFSFLRKFATQSSTVSAEQFLERVDHNQNFPQLLLLLIDKNEVDMTIRIAGAIAFKNYIKRNWGRPVDLPEDPDKIHANDREAIKRMIVPMMLKSPVAVQKQLSDAIQIIGKYDFPKKWPQLIDEMIDKFQTGDFHVINGVLKTAHSIFKRYRYEFKSQELWEEIKLVLEKFAKPLTDLLLVNRHKFDFRPKLLTETHFRQRWASQ